MSRAMRMLFIFASFALSLTCRASEPTKPTGLAELVGKSQRILFLGDSITHAGQYVAYFDAWLLTQQREQPAVVIDAGLPSETVSGLSEEGHAGGRFPRPDLAERLDRVLAVTKPDLVFACYGINCGIYQPFDEERFARYRDGIGHLKAKVEAAGAALVLITPPTFDDQRAKKEFSYNQVLDRYSQWLIEQRSKGWSVIDLHGPMSAYLAMRQKADPQFTLQPDAVHPNADGHWVIARELIRAVGEDADLNAQSPEQMLTAAGLDKRVLPLVTQRLNVRRDAYLSAAGHKRPGIRRGLAVPEAERKAEEMTRQIRELITSK